MGLNNYIIFLFFNLFFHSLKGQKIERVKVTKYTPETGLSSVNVRQVIQDEFGFIYVATQSGLDRFDGKNFLHYSKNSSLRNKILGSDIRSMVLDSINHLLWVLPGENGFSVIDTRSGSVIKNIPIKSEKANEWYSEIMLVEKKVWISTFNDILIFDIETNSFLSRINAKNKNNNEIVSFQKDENSNIWVLYRNWGLSILNEKGILIKDLIFKNHFPLVNTLNGLCSIEKGKKIAGTDKGLFEIKYNKFYDFKLSTFNNGYNNNNQIIESLYKTRHEDLYIATSSNLFLFKRNSLIPAILSDIEIEDDWFNGINCIYEDRSNNLWIGCNKGLLYYQIRPIAFESIYKSSVNENKLEHVTSIYIDKNNKKYISTYNGLAIFKEGANDFSLFNAKKKYDYVFEYDNKLIISNNEGLFVKVKENEIPISTFYKEFKDLPLLRVNKHICYNDSIIILSTENNKGILIWNYKLKTVHFINQNSGLVNLESEIVNSIFKNENGDIFVLSDNSITKISNNFTRSKVYKFFEKDNIQLGLFFGMIYCNDSYWLTSYGNGLIQLNKDFEIVRIFNKKDGLSDEGVYELYYINNYIFVSTNNGLSALNLKSNKFKVFYKEDGLQSNNFEEAVSFYNDSILYFGGLKGYTKVNSYNILLNKEIPNLSINKISWIVNDKLNDSLYYDFKSFSIPSNTTLTKISFIGLNYQNPTRVNYYYRIKELGNTWIDIKNQNFIDLIGISPGKYTLEVKAANEDGVECEPIKLMLHFLPKWYQTLLFKILLALAIAALLFILYTFRIRQLKKVIAVRQKISQNLHDDIGGTLSAINMYTQVAKLQPQQNDFLNSIEENTQDVLSKLDDIIWSTNPKNDKFSNLVNRMQTFAFPICKAKNVQFILNDDGLLADHKISEAVRQNLFYIFKEAINNALKYSGCTKIDVQMHIKNKSLTCSIIDNGKGFDTTIPTERNGLLNMQLRTKELNGNCTIDSKINIGTTVSVQIPL